MRRLDPLFAQPPPPTEPRRGSVPIGVRGGRFPPTSLARQVGGAAQGWTQGSPGTTRHLSSPAQGSGGNSPHGLVYDPPRVLAHAEPEPEQPLLEEGPSSGRFASCSPPASFALLL